MPSNELQALRKAGVSVAMCPSVWPLASVEAFGHALDELGQLDPSLAELVDLKFFCGLSFAEIAAMRGVSQRTVERNRVKAPVLHDALEHPPLSGSGG